MRIEGIEAIAIDIPLRRNFGGSTYAVLKRSTIVTRLRTDAGSSARSTTATTASTVTSSCDSSTRRWRPA